jgi:hypothetical protein
MNKIEIDLINGIETIIPMTEEEIAEHEARVIASAQAEADRLAAEEQARLDAEAKAAAKAAVLAKLGLTEEEINTFLA